MTALSDVPRIARESLGVAEAVAIHLEGLEPERWVNPSDCAGWSVANLACHLILVEALISGSINRGLQGDSGAPSHVPGGAAGWREYRAGEIERLTKLPPDELVRQFREGIDTVRGAIERISLGADRLGWHPSAGPQPLPWFAGQWLVEIALHDWDLRVAMDPGATLNPVGLPSLGPELRDRLPRCYKPAAGSATEGVLRIELAGIRPLTLQARLAEGKLELTTDGSQRPSATIVTDPGTFGVALTGRRPVHEFRASGRWQVVGDQALANHLAASFAGY